MNIRVFANYDQLSEQAARIICQVIREKPNAVLGLATGSSPIGLYNQLIEMHKESGLDFSQVTTFNLDEYVGISETHPQSYRAFMNKHLFSHLNIPLKHTHLPLGNAADLDRECLKYEKWIEQAGGIDIQILGIGNNGHIGFNEPGSDPSGKTGIVRLAEGTRKANARFFQSIDEVPTHAISMGIFSILTHSKQILLLASGDKKADAVSKMIEGELTAQVPASFLKLHSQVTVLLDRDAAQCLSEETLGRIEECAINNR